jgi:aryl-alcohol dehydrogenase-like predicted oxidoreductase
VADIGHTALGAWSGGTHMHYGEPLPEERLRALLRPGPDVHTVITADVYGEGAADSLIGRSLVGIPREDYALVGAIGHDFYEGQRDGPRGYPRFTDTRLRGESGYVAYLRMACERSLERCGVDSFDLLMLHNPDRIGYTSPVVWQALAGLRDEGLARSIGIAPGPANGFTLDVIDCLERYGDTIDWAMLILNPFEPWPARLALPACEKHGVKVIARVVDYGGLFHDDIPDEDSLHELDHRRYRPAGWVEVARARLAKVRPFADAHSLTPLQLACQWTLAQPAVACVVPTLIQEPGPSAKAVEAKRAELAALPREIVLDDEELREIEAIGDNAGSMLLKGGSPRHDGDERADAWPMNAGLVEVANRWGITPDRDLVKTM